MRVDTPDLRELSTIASSSAPKDDDHESSIRR